MTNLGIGSWSAGLKTINVGSIERVYGISQTCYRYQAKLSSENREIADWLLRLTMTDSDWGFGLCFDYLRNVEGFEWNHKRIYRIYCDLELNLRIRPKRRLNRSKPEPLKEPIRTNQVWAGDVATFWLEGVQNSVSAKSQVNMSV